MWISTCRSKLGIIVSHVNAITSFAFLQSITQLILAGLPQQANSSLGLSFPSAQFRTRDLLHRQVSKPAYVPPTGFAYPLDGFLPLIPSEFYFALTALLGFSPSKLYLLAVLSDVPITFLPTCRLSRVLYEQHDARTATPAATSGYYPAHKPEFLGFGQSK